ncbi:MAG: mannose-1-phosphate guanylyltransferase/mannose-6-phosphate isomerase [bacterium]|nr:mannose-1-phosphate guanylyltransferase/mannose-6-phosphate isomerase [bacterium]
MAIQPVILAGGTGTRLWPLSRELYPKQVIQLIGEHSLLQNTLLRVAGIPDVKPPLLVVGEEHRFMTQNQVQCLGLNNAYCILLEPVARNTAAAVCGAVAYHHVYGNSDDVLLILPADHLIRDTDAFLAAVSEAAQRASEGYLVTFGLVPSRPETGFGYIAADSHGKVECFVEKPDLATAQEYCAGGKYLWNSGMFAYLAASFLAEMQQHAPEIAESMLAAVHEGERESEHFFSFGKTAMARSPSISIDHALMERTKQAVVVRADLGWSDIGSWQTLWEVLDKDEAGNAISGDVLLSDVRNCLIRSDHSLLTAIGLEDTLVVQSADAVLVAPLSKSQEVRGMVDVLKQEKRSEYHRHRTVFRPWGSYTLLEEQPRFQIKRLSVNPGASLSLQRHRYRHEHWVVVSGVATVHNNGQDLILHEDEATHIPAGTIHRLANNEETPLELIEVQIGSYLGEDDIERFDDVYGRFKGRPQDEG